MLDRPSQSARLGWFVPSSAGCFSHFARQWRGDPRTPKHIEIRNRIVVTPCGGGLGIDRRCKVQPASITRSGNGLALLVQRNSGGFSGFLADDDLKLRIDGERVYDWVRGGNIKVLDGAQFVSG